MISTVDIHRRALDRQAQWEIDFTGAGDHESALDACLDALALAAELDITKGPRARAALLLQQPTPKPQGA